MNITGKSMIFHDLPVIDERLFSSNTTPNSLEDGSMSLNFSTLANDPISKRISSPINGQSKGSSNGSSMEQSRSQRNNGGNRTNGTTQSNNINNLTSSSYDTVMVGSVDDGFRESLSKNGSTKGDRFGLVEKNTKAVDITDQITRSLNSDFPPIISVEQRRKYKTEFDKDYAEYRKLHLIMDKARRRFANLQQELTNVNPSERKYKVIKRWSKNNWRTCFKLKVLVWVLFL